MVQRRRAQADRAPRRARLGIRHVFEHEDLGAAVLVDPHRLHRRHTIPCAPRGTGAARRGARPRRRRRDAGGAYEGTERHIRERRARGLFADMKFTMAQPERSCHPETPAARRAHGRLRRALLLRARARAARPGEGRLPRYTWYDALRGAARAKLDELGRRLGGDVPRPRRREPARRPRGGRAQRRRLLRQEHAADHAAPRLVGRARHARHRRRARADAAARRRLRRVPPLHRRLPDGRARRARDARRDEVPLLLDAGARGDPGGLPRASRRAGLRLRHLPGRLPVEPRHREAPRRRAARGAEPHVSLVDWLEADGDELAARYDRLYVPRNDGRWLQRNALVAAGNAAARPSAPLSERYAASEDELLARARRVGAASGSVGRGLERACARAPSSLASSRARAATAGAQLLGLEHDRLAALREDLAHEPVVAADGQLARRSAVRRAGARRARSPSGRPPASTARARRVASRRRARLEALARLERSSSSFALRMRSSRKLRSPSLVRSHVWTYQCGSSRSIRTARRRASTASRRPPSGTRSRRGGARDRPRSASRSDPPRPRRRAAPASARARTAPNVSSSLLAHAVERRVRVGGDHRPDELEREPDRARLERRQARRPRGTCRRRAPCRRAPRRRRARRRPRSSRRRS